jgi:3-deoxy-D-manno-octulosonate 8-phosphate phosphatase (KDO 8-P phosphatase)
MDVNGRASRIKLVLMDVDGVLTDGKLYWIPGPTGAMVEFKAFDSQDGMGLQWLYRNDIKTGVISGRNSPSTEERARQCKMSYVYQGSTEKIPLLEEILADSKIDRSAVAFVGDDLTDIVAMRRVGFAIATANARPEVKAAAHWVTPSPGGHGAIRDVAELILKAQGLWPDILKHYEAS